MLLLYAKHKLFNDYRYACIILSDAAVVNRNLTFFVKIFIESVKTAPRPEKTAVDLTAIRTEQACADDFKIGKSCVYHEIMVI